LNCHKTLALLFRRQHQMPNYVINKKSFLFLCVIFKINCWQPLSLGKKNEIIVALSSRLNLKDRVSRAWTKAMVDKIPSSCGHKFSQQRLYERISENTKLCTQRG
jgi:hypothetical protein